MNEPKFQIVVNGTLAKGAQPGQVRQNIATLFKTTLEKVEPMFSGRTLAVKKGLDRETAQKYQAAITRAGLAAAIAPMTDDAAPAGSALDGAALAAPGSIMDQSPRPAEPDIDTSDLSMGAVGEDVMEHAPVPEAQIDTSALSMGAPGEDVAEHEEIPPADIDTSGLSMGALGEDVTEHEAVPPADIDTSQLSLDEPTK